MSQHLLIAPIVLPLCAAVLLLLRRGGAVLIKRTIGIGTTLALVITGIFLVHTAGDGVIRFYALGDWQPPFGIVLVLDRLSAMMILLTAILALGAILYASAGQDEDGTNFQGLFQLQLLGINGAFLTGDLFNLFVFFEVLLIASYALLMHGGGRSRTGAGVHYVALNLAGSSLFLFALGILYGALGTLNMADMARQISAGLDAHQQGLVHAGGLLLLSVFALKSAMLPLHFWLPRAYAAAPASVAALFAIMTKIGLYAILRVYSLVFADHAGPLAGLAQPWLWWCGLATLAVAAIGVLSARDLRLQTSYLIMISVGTLLCAFGMGHLDSITAALYYIVHTTLVTGGLFLLADMIGSQRGRAGTRAVRSRPLVQPGRLGTLYFIGMIAVIGLPPLSGAIGKALVLSSAEGIQALWLWPILLLAGLCGIISASRAGSTIFWRTGEGDPDGPKMGWRRGLGITGLIAASPLLTLLAGPVSQYAAATAQQLNNPDHYLEAILGTPMLTPGAVVPHAGGESS
ncbi:monovalent cation/H+ antiporter subunit D [Kushneria phosphatilytica]|uniref:Monovalent cation/H+ antiporter subunit D n=1 Tax=Kushneria phosphatilytica TaxID=657387 RepID=A0A1S1NY99_9GAMM|nr:monovalent cation/H+ antiporter subunit D [Kushneria phosphatilytica]OHV12722.1 monovalent cation/H+ antiporter subunit D [Kushneria phosphatilytica]QEL10565.1 monovalent cation/H+ antiporter subunit D [Kushneria phosphatilytica]